MTKSITIAGKEYPVIFNMQTLLLYEDMTDGNFFESKFRKTSERMNLILAACRAADENTDITIDILKGNSDYDALYDVIRAFQLVSEMSLEFFRIPSVVAKAEKEENNDIEKAEEAPKN